jgi:hypothetical protein
VYTPTATPISAPSASTTATDTIPTSAACVRLLSERRFHAQLLSTATRQGYDLWTSATLYACGSTAAIQFVWWWNAGCQSRVPMNATVIQIWQSHSCVVVYPFCSRNCAGLCQECWDKRWEPSRTTVWRIHKNLMEIPFQCCLFLLFH